MLVYLDWNVFDRLEKKDRLKTEQERILYTTLMKILKREDVNTPYSNAHLRDLLRGFKKNPKFIDGHLNILHEVTNNLCLCQYWKTKNSTWHYRSVYEFFDLLKNEKELEEENFEDLIKFDTQGKWELMKQVLKDKPVPKEFKSIYSQDPIFKIMYPRTKDEMNHLALSSDLYNFSILMMKDYSLYRSLKTFLGKARIKVQKNPELMKSFKSVTKEAPDYLKIDSILDSFTKNQKLEKDKPYYNKILDTFLRYDLKGYKTDNFFLNMVDDGLHTFYTAHCDYFITNDDKCQYKAIKTYDKLKIKTKVFTATEFIESFSLD